jgi:hypothetical protein
VSDPPFPLVSLSKLDSILPIVTLTRYHRFYPNGRKSSHVRTSFSLVDLETEADEGFRRLAEAIKEWQRDNRKQ